MSLTKTIKDTLYYGIVPKLTTVVNLFILPIITPYLTPYDYGIWGVITSYTSILTALAPLGLNIHLTNSFFEYKKWRLVWGKIFFIFFLSGLIWGCISFIVILLSFDELPLLVRCGLALCGSSSVMLFGTSTVSSHLYPLVGKPQPLVFTNLLVGLLSILITFIVVYYLHLGYWGFAIASLGTSIFSFILFYTRLSKKEGIIPIPEYNIKRLKEWLKIALPVIPHTLGFVLLSSISRTIMSWYKIPLDDIGIFSNGYFIGDYVAIVGTALVTALSPQIQVAYRNRNYLRYRKLFYLCQLVVICVVACAAIWMPNIYSILIRNNSLQEASSIASMICYAQVLMPFYSFVSTIIFIEKKTTKLLWLVFVPGIMNTLLCLIFIPIFGYKAAIYSTLISYWSQIILPFIVPYFRSQIIQWLGSNYKLIYILIVLIVSFMFSSIAADFNYVLKIIITLSIGLFVLMSIKIGKLDKEVILIR